MKLCFCFFLSRPQDTLHLFMHTSFPSDSSLRTWCWRASEIQLSRICLSSSTCKRRSASWLTAVARILPFEAINDDLMCLFQNHHKVKTPESHPSRCVQEPRETAVSVSAVSVRVKNIFSIYSCVFGVFFGVNLESKMGHEWQDCPLTHPHMSTYIIF